MIETKTTPSSRRSCRPGTVVVQYAAFAGAWAASVWIPAELPDVPANRLDLSLLPAEVDGTFTVPVPRGTPSYKLDRIHTAAVLACAPIAPSRESGLAAGSISPSIRQSADVWHQTYAAMVPSSNANTRTDERILNKIAYSDLNTAVMIEWRLESLDAAQRRRCPPIERTNQRKEASTTTGTPAIVLASRFASVLQSLER